MRHGYLGCAQRLTYPNKRLSQTLPVHSAARLYVALVRAQRRHTHFLSHSVRAARAVLVLLVGHDYHRDALQRSNGCKYIVQLISCGRMAVFGWICSVNNEHECCCAAEELGKHRLAAPKRPDLLLPSHVPANEPRPVNTNGLYVKACKQRASRAGREDVPPT